MTISVGDTVNVKDGIGYKSGTPEVGSRVLVSDGKGTTGASYAIGDIIAVFQGKTTKYGIKTSSGCNLATWKFMSNVNIGTPCCCATTNDYIYVYAGNPSSSVFKVYRSDDGISWTVMITSAPMGILPRSGYKGTLVALGDDLYILGAQGFGSGEGKAVAKSTDGGATWSAVTADWGLGYRSGYGSTAHDGLIWVAGGADYNAGINYYNDVWASPDGANWTQMSTDWGVVNYGVWIDLTLYLNYDVFHPIGDSQWKWYPPTDTTTNNFKGRELGFDMFSWNGELWCCGGHDKQNYSLKPRHDLYQWSTVASTFATTQYVFPNDISGSNHFGCDYATAQIAIESDDCWYSYTGEFGSFTKAGASTGYTTTYNDEAFYFKGKVWKLNGSAGDLYRCGD